MCPGETKIFTFWPFAEKVCQPYSNILLLSFPQKYTGLPQEVPGKQSIEA